MLDSHQWLCDTLARAFGRQGVGIQEDANAYNWELADLEELVNPKLCGRGEEDLWWAPTYQGEKLWRFCEPDVYRQIQRIEWKVQEASGKNVHDNHLGTTRYERKSDNGKHSMHIWQSKGIPNPWDQFFDGLYTWWLQGRSNLKTLENFAQIKWKKDATEQVSKAIIEKQTSA